MTTKEEIIKIVDEDLILLYETLANFKQMKPAKQDKWNDKFIRETREEFVAQTRKDISWQLSLRKKLISSK